MKIQELPKKIHESNLNLYPFPHFLINKSMSEETLNNIFTNLEELEKTTPSSLFESKFGQKKEWKKFPENLTFLNELLEMLSSKEFISALKSKFGIDEKTEIFPDPSYDGGGYVISPPNSYLAYHADFNFSSNANMYRVLNILIYMNKNYQDSFGGELHLLDKESKTVEEKVKPTFGTMLGFFTDDTSFHGVSKNKNEFFRRSFNIYYYCRAPISPNQSIEPHKTIWVETKSHDH